MPLNSLPLKIINSKRYTKFRPLRYTLYIICFVLFYSTIRPLGRPSLDDYIKLNSVYVLLLLFILVIIAVGFYFYSRNYEILGSLIIGTDSISISLNNISPVTYPVLDLKNFKISRGATVHHIDDTRYPPETNDNWISFTFNGTAYKYEFAIENVLENDAFEKVVNEVRGMYDSFYYESI
ncbi:MAG: hypothetical protein IPP15_21245 [Saprospiraceae bacterium]|uniref:Uncharacterized protein n=1 Tax=Candidatus Opimibacter skivensis TaxID=2982028 RepID=A0A9D7SZ66_9BACT|nr:hypothetical protein [Candidatus Opimibacter skivensis]